MYWNHMAEGSLWRQAAVVKLEDIHSSSSSNQNVAYIKVYLLKLEC